MDGYPWTPIEVFNLKKYFTEKWYLCKLQESRQLHEISQLK